MPNVQDRLDELPSRLYGLRVLEQGSIPVHAIIDEGLVARRRWVAEVVRITEVHLYSTQVHEWARQLRAEAHLDTFPRLDPEDDGVGIHMVHRGFETRTIF